MRKIMATLVATAGIIGFSTAVGSTSAANGAARSFDACSHPLDPDRREVIQLENGGDTLPYGRMIVTATKEFYHRYCIQIQTGGRVVTGSYSFADYRRVDGVCGRQLGAAGSGTMQTRGFTQTLTVAADTCSFVSFSIKDGGRWYNATASRVRN